MSVDYMAHFGIGYEVTKRADFDMDDPYGDLYDCIFAHESDGFEIIDAGDGAYTGEQNTVYVIIQKPFSGGLDLTAKKAALDAELDRLKLEPVGEVGVVGGLYVY